MLTILAIGLILDRFRISAIPLQLHVPIIQSFKQQLQKLTGLRITLQTFEASSANHPENGFIASCQLPKGWYMIEASPDANSLGSTLIVQCHSGKGTHVMTGKQVIQLGNTRVAKRLIHVEASSACVHLICNTQLSVDELPELTFVRLSKNIAQDRMLRALRNAHAKNSKRPDFVANPEPHNALIFLYKAYCHESAASNIADTYRKFHRKYDTSASLPISRLRSQTAYSMQYSLIQTAGKDISSSIQEDHAPLLILATGDVMLHDSFLRTLDELSASLQSNSNEKQLWYTDHDHINNVGDHVAPYFKPGWNVELLRQGNYIGALLIVTKKLYQDLGGLNFSMGESALFDFLLRSAEVISEDAVQRIPGIRYAMPESRYLSPHGFFIGKQDDMAMEAYARRHAQSGLTISPGSFAGLWKACRPLQDKQPRVDILIPTRDRVDLLKQCIGSITALTRYDNYTITVIDNDSEEAGTLAFHAQMSSQANYRKLDYCGEFNYSAINNLAAAESDAEYLVLLNNDTEVLQENWLQRMVQELSQIDVACVGTRLIYPNGLLQHAGVTLGLHGVAGHRNQFALPDDHGYAASISLCADVSAVTGACLGIRRSLYQSLGGLNAKDLRVAFNDVDLCLRARNLGYRNLYLADVTLKHHESVSRGMDDNDQKRARFQSEVDFMKKTHAYWINDDPSWHPLFSRRSVKPSVHYSAFSDLKRYAA